MKYVGSKARIAKEIIPIMLKYRGDRPWVEPFVGGGNLIENIEGVRIGYDGFLPTIQALISIRDKLLELPRNAYEFSEENYKSLKGDIKHPLFGYGGFSFSFGGKFFGGWCRGGTRDYVSEAFKNAEKQSPKLQGVWLEHKQYRDIVLTKPSLIYCDPPYQNTTKYLLPFDHEDFFNWCREKKAEGLIIFLSEYSAPPDFISLWSKNIVSSLTKDTGSKTGNETLFILL